MAPLLFDIILAGGGIMALGCALEEAERGKKVCLLDVENFQGKASWASAGLLGTRDCRKFFSFFREFSVKSIQMFPQWLSRISALSGKEIPFYCEGDYQFFDLEREGGEYQFQKALEALKKEEAQHYEILTKAPSFLKTKTAFSSFRILYFPQDSHVSSRALLEGLYQACQKRGVVFFPQRKIQKIEASASGVEVKTCQESFQADHLLMAAGVWSNELLNLLGMEGPMIPVKGQLFRLPHLYNSKATLHYHQDLYLVPRPEGLIVGATTEPHIWQEDFNLYGQNYLQNHLEKFFPQATASPLETWVGIRPRTQDRLPWMGILNEYKNISICAGHYKSGIGMAPLSALSMSCLINGEETPLNLEPFSPWRKKGLRRK